MSNMRARRELHQAIRASLRDLATEQVFQAADDAGRLVQYTDALRQLETVARDVHSDLIDDLNTHRDRVAPLLEEFEIGDY